MTRLGQRDQLITLASPSATADELGQTGESWTDQGEVWARSIQTTGTKVPGREFLSGDYQAQDKVVFDILWRGDVTSAWRVTWNGRIYGIDATAGTQREGASLLYCTSREGAD